MSKTPKDIASGPDKDPDKTEPVLFSEAFRRAKRNALFAGTLVVLIAVGTANTDGIQLTSAVKGLALSFGAAFAGAWAFFVFALIGF